jgi:hypothetical protein
METLRERAIYEARPHGLDERTPATLRCGRENHCLPGDLERIPQCRLLAGLGVLVVEVPL